MRQIDADALIKYLNDDWLAVSPCGNGNSETDKERAAMCRGIDRAIKTVAAFPAASSGWINVKDRLPAETHSIFFPWYGKKEWSKSMWREQSDKVLVTVAFKDGSRIVTTGETHDGVWNTTISRTLEPVVTHWMPMPAPPEMNSPEAGTAPERKKNHDE